MDSTSNYQFRIIITTMELDKEQISAVMSAFGKRGRNNLREKLGEDGFKKYMGELGKKNKGKKRKPKLSTPNLQSNS